MSRIASDRLARIARSAAVVLIAGAAATPLHGQAPRVVSSEIEMSRQAAELRLELDAGRRFDIAVRDGRLRLDGRDIGAAPRGGEFDRAWRDLLNRAMDVPSGELGEMLAAWTPPDTEAGRQLAAEIQRFFVAEPAAPAAPAPAEPVDGAQMPDALRDSVQRVRAELEQLRRENERLRRDVARETQQVARGPEWTRPLRHVWRGITGLFSLLLTYAVLFGIAVVAIFFGARRYIEAVADTARKSPGRSFAVGIAGTFLAIPAYVLGIIALAISIVGIPLLLLWAPLFPVAFLLAVLLGYLSVAHAAGESVAERRFTAETWFERGNSYYFLLTGLGLLMAFFIGGYVVQMGGPWLGFLRGLLFFIGGCVTWIAFTIGLGAVLITRAGSRPERGTTADIDADLFTEGAGI